MSKSPVDRTHDGSGTSLFLFETACVLIAYVLVIVHAIRLLQNLESFHWVAIPAIAIAWLFADFMSGLVHWLADTWGREDYPILGPRFLKPFRVHHDTPTSFVECGFMDTNGDTALIGIPFLLSIFLWPLNFNVGFVMASFQLAFCFFALPTNQIHQWAHSPKPPKVVEILQRLRLILPPDCHQLHHAGTHDRDYCITSGCCNRILERIQFFRTLEWMVEQSTGFKPRSDENRKDEHKEFS
jgi:plasmanylethanolamine desaturase